MKIVYKKGDLLDAKGIIAHSCNINGMFGSGIAFAIKQRYPKAHKYYKEECAEGNAIRGEAQLVPVNQETIIANMFVVDYDTKIPLESDDILIYTKFCLESLAVTCERQGFKEINIPKINSGIFGVPWELTEEVIKGIKSDVKVIVWIKE